MVKRMKALVQIGMIVLTMGLSMPPSLGSDSSGPTMKSCCCSGDAVCACPHEKPCADLCRVGELPAHGRDVVTGSALTASPRLSVALFTLAPVQHATLAALPKSRQWEVNVSPPFGGSPPQAILRLWLV
jgi:hypothetical protein